MKLTQLTKIIGLSLPILLSSHYTYAKEEKKTMTPEQIFLVGTWTGTPEDLHLPPAFPSEGIYTVKLNKDGTLRPLHEIKIPHPSWITFSKDHQFAYVTNETEKGHVTALSVAKDGSLKQLNQVESLGDHPTHASVSLDGKYLFAANYSVKPENAGISVFPIKKDGSLEQATQNIVYKKGSGIVEGRQDSGHAHSVVFSPNGQTAYVADLGADLVRGYDYTPNEKEPLKENKQLEIDFPKGSGPRHLLFSKDGQFLYITSEMSAQVSVFQKQQGKYHKIQTENLAVKDHEDHKSAAGLVFSPDGQFLYVGNRKKINEIVAYKVNQTNGKLTLVGRYPSGGLEPRAFAIDHSGEYMIVSNVLTHTVSEFKRNKVTGALTPTRVALQIGLPTDIKFLP